MWFTHNPWLARRPWFSLPKWLALSRWFAPLARLALNFWFTHATWLARAARFPRFGWLAQLQWFTLLRWLALPYWFTPRQWLASDVWLSHCHVAHSNSLVLSLAVVRSSLVVLSGCMASSSVYWMHPPGGHTTIGKPWSSLSSPWSSWFPPLA